MWGSDPPKAGAVEQHVVKSISYHQGGSSRRAKGAQPFATIELEVRGAKCGVNEVRRLSYTLLVSCVVVIGSCVGYG